MTIRSSRQMDGPGALSLLKRRSTLRARRTRRHAPRGHAGSNSGASSSASGRALGVGVLARAGQIANSITATYIAAKARLLATAEVNPLAIPYTAVTAKIPTITSAGTTLPGSLFFELCLAVTTQIILLPVTT